jgi:hypothetical protein
MDWLRREDNAYFARALVNRVWASYFHLGIVNPPDDLSLANPPSNKPLLDYLASGFTASGYDMKWLHREIANSRTYQLSWVSNPTNELDLKNFSHAIPRRLPAELVYDAVRQATSAEERLSTSREDLEDRAIALAGATSQRRGSGVDYALSVFGRSTRESNCDCDRSVEASLLQTVFLQNDRDLLSSLDRKGGWLDQLSQQFKPRGRANGQATMDALEAQQSRLNKQRELLKRRILRGSESIAKKQLRQMQSQLQQLNTSLESVRAELAAANSRDPEADEQQIKDWVRQAYLRTVSRPPNDHEVSIAVAYLRQAEDPVGGFRDVLWALLNTKEFIVNH